MSSFPYNTVPIATHNPSVDQPNMLVDTVSIANLIAIDHIGFNATGGGYHKQVTFLSPTTQSTQSGVQSVAYTKLGILNNSTPQLLFVNSAATFMLNAIRAFVCFQNDATIITQFNVVSVVKGGGIYAITLATNCTTGNNIAVISTGFTQPITYTYANPLLTITGVVTVQNASTILVLQN